MGNVSTKYLNQLKINLKANRGVKVNNMMIYYFFIIIVLLVGLLRLIPVQNKVECLNLTLPSEPL